MPKYISEALDIALSEIRRNRDEQLKRATELQSRAGVLITASGLAAGLVSATASSGWWLLPIGAFLTAAIFGVLTQTTARHMAIQPDLVFRQANGQNELQFKVDVIEGMISEYQLEENRLSRPRFIALIGAAFFTLAIVLVFGVAAADTFNPVIQEPSRVQIVEDGS